MRHGEIQHVLKADHIGGNGADRIGRILFRMCVGRQMKHIVHVSNVLSHKRQLHIVRDETKMRILPVLFKARAGFLRASSQGVDPKVQTVQVLLHQNVDQKTADQAGCAGKQQALPGHFLPRQVKARDGADVFHI